MLVVLAVSPYHLPTVLFAILVHVSWTNVGWK